MCVCVGVCVYVYTHQHTSAVCMCGHYQTLQTIPLICLHTSCQSTTSALFCPFLVHVFVGVYCVVYQSFLPIFMLADIYIYITVRSIKPVLHVCINKYKNMCIQKMKRHEYDVQYFLFVLWLGVFKILVMNINQKNVFKSIL